jgi:hypothetical protein
MLAAPAATVVDSSPFARTRPVALTYRMPAELQCGHLRASSVRLELPRAMSVPRIIVPRRIRVNGETARSVETSGHTIVIGIRQPSGIQCDAISTGTLTVTITGGAGLGNPPAAGLYAFRITVGTTTAAPRLRISS